MSNFLVEMANNFHFLRPWFLLLLAVPAVFYFILFRNDANLSSWEKVCDKKFLDFLLIKGNNHRRKFSVFLIYTGLILSVLSLAGPTWQKEEQPLLINNAPLVILLNLSTDMQQKDILPNRLTRAKMEIASLLEQKELAGVESGLIVYTAEPFMISALSDDAQLIINLLPAINFDIMPLNGDRLDRAINYALAKIKAAGYQEGSIVVFGAAAGTDFVAAQTAARQAKAAGMIISTVNMTMQPNAGLKQIATAGGGIAVNVAEVSTLARKIDTWWQKDKTESKNVAETWRDFGYYLLFMPLLCCLYFFRRGLLALVFFVSLSMPAVAGFFLNNDQEAMKLYEKGEYAEAAKKFKNEQWQGSSWYRAGNYAQAADSFAKAKDTENIYNYGNALAKSGDIAGAIKQYEEVLKQNPQHEDAKYNLEYLKQQQQNPQQKEQQNQEKEQQSSSTPQPKEQNKQQNQEQNQEETSASEDFSADEKQQEQQSSANSEESEELNQSKEVSAPPQNKKQNLSQTAEEEQQRTASAKEGEKNEKYDEEAQARTQQFREIPEDKGGLLRAFIYKEYKKNRYGGIK